MATAAAAAALTHTHHRHHGNTACISSFPIPHNKNPWQLSKPYRLLLPKPVLTPPFLLFANPPSSAPLSQPSPPIFLPLLQQQEEEEEEDQLVRFFKSRASSSSSSSSTEDDPPVQAKFALDHRRRSKWHLAPNFLSLTEPDKIDPEAEIDFIAGNQETHFRTLLEGVVGEIVRIARDLRENVTLGERLVGFEGRIRAEECVEVLEIMGEEGMMIGCLYFFEWMGLQEPSLVSSRSCTVLFPQLGRAGMADELIVLLGNLPKTKEFRDVHVYNAAISGLLCCRRYDDAWKVYDTMESNNVTPDHVTSSIMITIMRKTGRSAKEAWDFFERMNRKGVKWSPEVLGALIKSFCDEGLKNEALIIQSEMEKKGIASNAIVYNTLMDAYSKSNHIEEAEGLFAEMKSKGLSPTPATFNILMDTYSRRRQPEIVEKLLLEMQDAGLQPNAKSYTCLISAYGRQKKMSEMAANAFLRMKKVGIKPTSHSYTALIHAYSVCGWHEKAYTAFENMLMEGVKPSVETYTALLDAFRRAGDTQSLMKIWRLMRSEKVEGTRVTFNILIDGFAKQGLYMEARDAISEFGKVGLQPTVMTYNMLMNAYARGGQHTKLPQLLKEMSARDLKPDSVTYMTMIYAYVRVRDFSRAFFYHKKMVRSKQVPDAKAYQKLRAILDVKAATKNKKDRKAILGIVNSKMGLLKVKKKGKKDEFWKNKKKWLRTSSIASDER